MADHLQHKGFLPIINAPVCLCNGSVIYDCFENNILWQSRLAYTVQEFLNAIAQIGVPLQRLHIFYCDMAGSVSYEDLQRIEKADLGIQPAKILCRFETPQQADTFKAAAAQLPFFAETHISKSFSVGVEFNAWDATKGHALQYIKQYLGNIHTAVGIGDYENDLTLLACADIAVAVENAEPCLKEIADMTVVSHTEFAIRDLIRRLEEKL